MDYNIKGVAERLKGLREMMGYSVEYVCGELDITKDELELIESGEKDFSITLIYKCSELYGVDLIEILTGDNPKLQKYTIVRKDKGLPIERRERFEYQHLAYMFKNKSIEPLIVNAPYDSSDDDKPILLSSHEGQEFDYVLEGTLKFVIDGKTEIVNAGDSVYYDSKTPHGMIAINSEGCRFLAVLIKK
ncbi:MAG: cupin domain-containing protein [Clostridiales bacterium]|nr:cupin domain-containing protein [Clostridiales bacterium]